jgi:hypothetical protein
MVGATLAGAVAVVVAFATGGLGTALGVLVVVILVQQLERNVLSPLLVSCVISFPPIVTLLLTTSAVVVLGVPRFVPRRPGRRGRTRPCSKGPSRPPSQRARRLQ